MYQAQGDAEGAQEALRKANEMTQSDAGELWRRRAAAWQARLWVAQGNLAAATQWAKERGLSPEDEPSYPREIEHLTLARLLIAQGKYDKVAALLGALLEAAEKGGKGKKRHRDPRPKGVGLTGTRRRAWGGGHLSQSRVAGRA
jgi:LuxR family transcriptional regulator, maltose regulon positive regulatory protein